MRRPEEALAAPPEPETDAELVHLSFDGDTDAFAELYARHARAVAAPREAFVRAWCRRPQLREGARFGAWTRHRGGGRPLGGRGHRAAARAARPRPVAAGRHRTPLLPQAESRGGGAPPRGPRHHGPRPAADAPRGPAGAARPRRSVPCGLRREPRVAAGRPVGHPPPGPRWRPCAPGATRRPLLRRTGGRERPAVPRRGPARPGQRVGGGGARAVRDRAAPRRRG